LLTNSNRFRDRYSFRFLGVRFALQPERFTYSTPYEGTGQNQSATEYGPTCIDFSGVGSEDCLVLNIWTPFLPLDDTNSRLKSVILFVHGVGFTANEPALNGASLASRGDVVVVVINSRQLAFGSFALDDGITNGNYELGDAVTALDWVRANIQDFGGNPNNITMMAQSFGATSLTSLLGSPMAIGQVLRDDYTELYSWQSFWIPYFNVPQYF
jgi:carboxylesterase type B